MRSRLSPSMTPQTSEFGASATMSPSTTQHTSFYHQHAPLGGMLVGRSVSIWQSQRLARENPDLPVTWPARGRLFRVEAAGLLRPQPRSCPAPGGPSQSGIEAGPGARFAKFGDRAPPRLKSGSRRGVCALASSCARGSGCAPLSAPRPPTSRAPRDMNAPPRYSKHPGRPSRVPARRLRRSNLAENRVGFRPSWTSSSLHTIVFCSKFIKTLNVLVSATTKPFKLNISCFAEAPSGWPAESAHPLARCLGRRNTAIPRSASASSREASLTHGSAHITQTERGAGSLG